MLRATIYLIIGFMLGIVFAILTKYYELIVSPADFWTALNTFILTMTALIVVLYTYETHLLRIHTTKVDRPLLHWTGYIKGVDGRFAITENIGYDKSSPPKLSIDVLNFGKDKALISKIQILNFRFPFRKLKAFNIIDYPSIMEPEEHDSIDLEYHGTPEVFSNIDEYSKAYKQRTTSGISILHGVQTAKFEKSKEILAVPKEISFILEVEYQNLAGTKFKTRIKVKNKNLIA